MRTPPDQGIACDARDRIMLGEARELGKERSGKRRPELLLTAVEDGWPSAFPADPLLS